jgi:hypothetical protein
LLENKDPYNEDLIATFYKPDNPEGRMYISHFELSQTDKNLSNEKFLQNILSSHESTAGFRLVSKNDDVVVDGLSGVSLTYTYQGEELNQTRKITKVYLRDTDDYYFLRYDDLDTQYEKYIGDFQSILQSFRNLNEETMVKDGEYKIGTLNSVFEDIAHHRYEQSIAKLKDEGIIDGYRDNTFRPEKYVSRAEALKIMLESKVTADKKKKNDDGLKTELSDFENGEYTQLDFLDTEKISWLKKYVRYARSKNIVTGYGNTMFLPDATVTIAEACKMLFGIYEIPVWNPDSSTVKYDGPWYKPYMDKGFSLEIIPYGIYVPDHQLTRAELAHIIATFLEKNS